MDPPTMDEVMVERARKVEAVMVEPTSVLLRRMLLVESWLVEIVDAEKLVVVRFAPWNAFAVIMSPKMVEEEMELP